MVRYQPARGDWDGGHREACPGRLERYGAKGDHTHVPASQYGAQSKLEEEKEGPS